MNFFTRIILTIFAVIVAIPLSIYIFISEEIAETKMLDRLAEQKR